jgi:tetratricopeptide (TPR) repeat protein
MKIIRTTTFAILFGLCSCSPRETPESALYNARRLAEQGRYEDALQKHLWFHEHALEQDRSYYGVRLSFALAQWVELGKQYPPALDALKRIRDRDTALLVAGKTDRELMNDVTSINDYLQETEATVEIFKRIEASHPEFATQVYGVVDNALIEAGAYALARKYLGDPMERFATAKRNYDNGITYAMSHSEHRDASREATESIFTNRMLRFITVLDRTGDRELARDLQVKTLKVLDSPRIRAALDNPFIEPGAAPNGGPAAPVDNTTATEGRHR